jgi:hypothetical protein
MAGKKLKDNYGPVLDMRINGRRVAKNFVLNLAKVPGRYGKAR